MNGRWTVPGVCVFLAAITFAVFGQTLRHEFVNFDDNVSVFENRQVCGGLTWKGIVWAFTHVHGGHWIPLTTLSHMLDCQLYGLNAGGHHLTNLLLHTASVILLFLVLRRMTAVLWSSAFVAAMFAVHPLHVESVAWVTERKDVLSGLFFMLTLWAYVRYAQGRSRAEGRESRAQAVPTLGPRPSALDYCLVVFLFALGLMSKSMVATLPLALLLLDYWPLNRFAQPSPTDGGDNTRRLLILRRLILEKVPMLAIVVAAGMGVLFARTEHSVVPGAPFLQSGYAIMTPVVYLVQMFHPAGLAVYCPPPKSIPLLEIALAATLLVAISAGVFVLRRKRPYLLVGWFWYLVMLAPVLVLIQQGMEIRCDRYTYLPQIGVYLLLTWAAADLCASWNCRRLVPGAVAAALTAASILSAWIQTSYWRNSESLWIHTLACTSNNATAHCNLGNALIEKGSVDDAIAHYQKALQIAPGYAEALNNLGNALLQKGSVDDAITHFQKALQIGPDNAEAHYNLGNALLQKGKMDEAIVHYQRALQIKPDYAKAHYNLGSILLQKGSVDEAIAHYQKALEIKPDHVKARISLGTALLQKGRADEAITNFQMVLQIKPDDADACVNLGNALLQKGKMDEAIVHYQKALEIMPDNLEVQNNMAWVLATAPQASLRNGNRAVKLAERANQLAGGRNPVILRALAAAYAEAGRFGDARRSAQEAIELARAAGQQDMVEQLNGELKLYEAGLPFHQESK